MENPHENILGTRDRSLTKGPSRTARTTASTSTKRKRGEPNPDPAAQARRAASQAKRAKKLEDETNKIFVGVDLGTTYTGAAYLTGASPTKSPDIINKWGRGQRAFQDKTPSVIAYSEDNEEYGGVDRWGCSVKAGDVSYAWWKLLLDETTEAAGYDDPLLSKVMGENTLRLPAGKSAVTVCTDYLGHIYSHILERLGESLGAASLLATPLVFCLTVPATWSPCARDKTRRAATSAGFGSRVDDELMMIDEPQAGILDVLIGTVEKFKKQAVIFEKGSTVLNCDLGGGTLDLISYKISCLDPLRLEEAAVGVGAKAGASSIDRNFWKFCAETFGVAFTEVPLRQRATGSKMMADFETIKQEFLGVDAPNQETALFVRLRMKKADMEDPNVRCHYDEDEGLIRFSPEELQSWFQPILDNGFQLIRKQIDAVKKARLPRVQNIVLTGGLAANSYVEQTFKALVREHSGGNISCLVPERAWSAICRGAALHARDKTIVSHRRARDNLGYPIHVPFENGVHIEQDRIKLTSGMRAKNQMQWSIRRGQRISRSTRAQLHLYAEFSDDRSRKQVRATQEIFLNQEDDPPTRLDDSCLRLGTLEMDLTDPARKARAKATKANGHKNGTTSLDMKIEVYPADDKGVLVWRAVAGPRLEVGKVKLEYHADTAARKR